MVSHAIDECLNPSSLPSVVFIKIAKLTDVKYGGRTYVKKCGGGGGGNVWAARFFEKQIKKDFLSIALVS